VMAALLADAPALPLHEAGKYVAAAYITVFVLVLVYIAVMALRVGRIERDLAALAERRGEAGGASEQRAAEQGQR
jgi:hypothetical protein